MKTSIKVAIATVTLAVTAGGVTTLVDVPYDGVSEELEVPMIVFPETEANLDPEPIDVAGVSSGGTSSGGNTSVATSGGFPADYPCADDATDGSDNTPADVAWVDDGGTCVGGDCGAFENPYDIDELVGETPSVELYTANGIRHLCLTKIASNYTQVDGEGASTAWWVQGALQSAGASAEAFKLWAYPATWNSTGSDAAFGDVPLIKTNWGSRQMDVGNAAKRCFMQASGFRIGDGTGVGCFRQSFVSDDTNLCQAVTYSFNYTNASCEAGTADNSGNDAVFRSDASISATIEQNYIVSHDESGSYAQGIAYIRDFDSDDGIVRRNTVYACTVENGVHFAYPKRDNERWLFENNLVISKDCTGGKQIGGLIYHESGIKDASGVIYERNQLINQRTSEWNAQYGWRNGYSTDGTIMRDNLVANHATLDNTGRGIDGGCPTPELDTDSSTGLQFTNNIFLNISDGIRWFNQASNQPSNIDGNRWFNFAGFARGNFIREQVELGTAPTGGLTNCGGAETTNNVSVLATYNALSYVGTDFDEDPNLVCQVDDDGPGGVGCWDGTPWQREDWRHCTGAGTPDDDCVSAASSTYLDVGNIAKAGPFRGEDMDDDPSTYTEQFGTSWIPPASYRAQ